MKDTPTSHRTFLKTSGILLLPFIIMKPEGSRYIFKYAMFAGLQYNLSLGRLTFTAQA